MNQITDQIWIGNSGDARNADALRAAGITHILNVAEDLVPHLGWKEGFTHFHIGLRDDTNHHSFYVSAIQALIGIVRLGHKVLVHCHEGRSRSVYVVACYLSQNSENASIEDNVALIREKGRDVKVAHGHFNSFP